VDAAPRKNRPWTNVVGLATVFLIFPLGVAFIIGWVLATIALHLALLVAWLPRGRRVLFVTSDADGRGKRYIDEHVLPQLPRTAVILDGTTRAQWSPLQLGPWLFRMWSGPRADGPLAIVVRPWAGPRVFRFSEPLIQLDRGHPEAVQTVQRELQAAIS
jgi:hypothetical protein